MFTATKIHFFCVILEQTTHFFCVIFYAKNDNILYYSKSPSITQKCVKINYRRCAVKKSTRFTPRGKCEVYSFFLRKYAFLTTADFRCMTRRPNGLHSLHQGCLSLSKAPVTCQGCLSLSKAPISAVAIKTAASVLCTPSGMQVPVA